MTNVKLVISLCGSGYTCEQLFSKMKYIKNHLRTRFRDDHLDFVFLLGSTISLNVNQLWQNKQEYVFH